MNSGQQGIPTLHWETSHISPHYCYHPSATGGSLVLEVKRRKSLGFRYLYFDHSGNDLYDLIEAVPKTAKQRQINYRTEMLLCAKSI